MQRYDLVIVGAGPAGCLTALSAPASARMLMIERLRLPRDVICGGIVHADVMKRLEHLEPPRAVFSEPARIRWSLLDWSLEMGGPFTDRQYFNVDRAAFDAWLLERAKALENLDVRESTNFTGMEDRADGIRVQFQQHRRRESVVAGHLVGADGALSSVRKALGVDAPDYWVAIQETVRSQGAAVDRFLAFIGEGIGHYGWFIPKGRDAAVGIGISRSGNSPRETYELFRERLRRRHGIDGASLEKPRSRPVTRLRSAREICPGRGRVLLVGEAAGLICPWSGEGIGHAVRSGCMAGRALAAGNPLRSYRRRLMRLMPGMYFDLFGRKSMKRPWARRLIALGAPGTDFTPLSGSPYEPADG